MTRIYQAPDFNRRAAVHNHIYAGRLSPLGGLITADFKLHPNSTDAFFAGDGDGFIGDFNGAVYVAENINHLKVIRNLSQRVVDFFAMDEAVILARVHRDHPIAQVLEELHDSVAGPVRFGTGTDHGNGFNTLEYIGDMVV